MNDQKPETFEAKIERLEGIVKDIEEGRVGLEESIRKYEDGMKLLKECRRVLSEAEQRIQTLQKAEDGTLQPSTEPEVPHGPEA
jgi:exodeoxyribonuclease VII small subunit